MLWINLYKEVVKKYPGFNLMGLLMFDCVLVQECSVIRSNTLIWENEEDLGPVVQSVVSLTSSLRVISLTVLADSIHNILIFFVEKM